MLGSAIAVAGRRQAQIVVARLDRLSRSVLVTAQLLASNVDYVAVDMPQACRLTLQLSALMAEYESRLISARTRDAMQAAKERGMSFATTSWHFTPETRLKAAVGARASHIARAREAYADIAPIAAALRSSDVGWKAIALHLNALGHTTRTGGPWGIHSVQALVRRETREVDAFKRLVLANFKKVASENQASMKPPDAATTSASVTADREHRDALQTSPIAIADVGGGGVARRGIAYLRVSMRMQGSDGLGMGALCESIRQFCAAHTIELLAEYGEVESAWKTPLDRGPQLVAALAHARAAGATIVIARLDRLACNVSIVHRLLETRQKFVCVDAPWASEMTLVMLPALAEQESRVFGDRIRAVRAEAKAAGQVWRHVSNLKPDQHAGAIRRSAEVRRARTRERYAYIEPIALDLRSSGKSLKKIADDLNTRGFRTQRESLWTEMSVQALLRRCSIRNDQECLAIFQR